MFEGDILKPVKTRPQYKHIWKEIWQVLTYPHGLLFGLVLRWWKSVRQADERRGIWNTSDGKFSDCSLERCELGYGLRLSTFCIGCHWNTLLLPDVSSTEAFDRFLRLMICTFFSLGANPLVRWMLLDKHEGPSSPSIVASITCCLGLTAESIALSCKYVADLQYHFFLWRFWMEHEGNDEEHQTAFMPAFLTVYLRDTVMADWFWEKKTW